MKNNAVHDIIDNNRPKNTIEGFIKNMLVKTSTSFIYSLFRAAYVFFIILIFSSCAVKTTPPQELVTAQSLSEQGQYKGALKYYQIAYNRSSSEEEKSMIKPEIEKLKTRIIENALKEADSIYNSDDKKTLELLESTLSILKSALPYDDRQKRIKEELEEYENEKETMLVYIGNQLKKARSLYNENKLREVIPVYEKILVVNPSNKLIRSKKANIKIEIETIEKRYLRNVQEYSKAGYTESARLFLEKLLQLNPNHPSAAQIRKELAISKRSGASSRLKDFERQKKWFTAYNVLKHSSGIRGSARAMTYIKTKGSKYYYERSIRDFVAGDYYSAYIAIDKARILDQNDKGIIRAAQLCEEKLEKELRKSIVINVSHPQSSFKNQFDREIEKIIAPLLPYGMSMKKNKKKGKRFRKMSNADTIVNVYFKGIDQSEIDYNYVHIQIMDFEGSALNYVKDTNMPSNSFIIPVTHTSKSSGGYLEKIDNISGDQKLSHKIAHMVAKNLGAREKRFYQLAAMHEELGQEKKELKYLALGSLYCKQARMSNQDCDQLRTLSLSVTE